MLLGVLLSIFSTFLVGIRTARSRDQCPWSDYGGEQPRVPVPTHVGGEPPGKTGSWEAEVKPGALAQKFWHVLVPVTEPTSQLPRYWLKAVARKNLESERATSGVSVSASARASEG
jgi:hypothetical protein